jgi:hypothetical protein
MAGDVWAYSMAGIIRANGTRDEVEVVKSWMYEVEKNLY